MVPENNIKIRKVNDMNQLYKQKLWQIKTTDKFRSEKLHLLDELKSRGALDLIPFSMICICTS